MSMLKLEDLKALGLCNRCTRPLAGNYKNGLCGECLAGRHHTISSTFRNPDLPPDPPMTFEKLKKIHDHTGSLTPSHNA